MASIFADSSARVRDHLICDVELVNPQVLNENRDISVVIDSPGGILKGRFFTSSLRGTTTKTYWDLGADPKEASPLSTDDPIFADDITRARELWRAYVDR